MVLRLHKKAKNSKKNEKALIQKEMLLSEPKPTKRKC